MDVAFSVFVSFAAVASRAAAFRMRRMLRLAIVAVIVLGALSGPAASRSFAGLGFLSWSSSFEIRLVTISKSANNSSSRNC